MDVDGFKSEGNGLFAATSLGGVEGAESTYKYRLDLYLYYDL